MEKIKINIEESWLEKKEEGRKKKGEERRVDARRPEGMIKRKD